MRTVVVAARAVARVRAWLGDVVGEAARHPARLVWTLVITAAYIAAAHPLWADGHAWWAHARTMFLNNSQIDYGEGPLLNQEVLLFHWHNIYRLGDAPPFQIGNYPPVFPLVAALFMHHYGQTFMAGRLVSSLAIMGAAIIAGLIVLQTTRQVLAAFIGGALLLTFSGIYEWGAYNRVDSLALFWSLATVLVVLRYAGTRKIWWAVPLAVLTIYTRQSLIDGIFAAFVYLLLRDWRRALAVGVATAAAILAVFIGLQIWSHGAFYLNTVVFNENAWNWGGTTSNWHSWMGSGGRLIFRLAIAGAAVGLLGRGGPIWAIWLAGATAVFATIGKTGAAINYFFPIYAASTICLGVFIGGYRRFFARAPFFLWPLEIVLPALLFFFIHGTAPGWAAHVPLLPRIEAVTGRYTLHSAQVTSDARLLARKAAASKANGPAARPPRTKPPTGIPNLARFLTSTSGPVLALDFPRAEVVQSGHEMQWQPFEFGVAYNDGHWNPQALVNALDDRYYALIVLSSFSQFAGYDGGFADRVQQAVETNYTVNGSNSGLQLWRPDGPPVLPNPVPVPVTVPTPLPDLGRALLHGLAHLPGHVVHALRVPRTHHTGSFTGISLQGHLQVVAAGTPGRRTRVGFDGQGDTLPADLFGTAGPLQALTLGGRVPFWTPPTGSHRGSAADLRQPVVLALPSRPATTVWLLGAASSDSVPVSVDVHYATGSDTRSVVTFPGWCSAAGLRVVSGQHLDAGGQTTTQACGLYALRVGLDPRRRPERLVLGPVAGARVMAVTLQDTA